jgi:hypothetical protein
MRESLECGFSYPLITRIGGDRTAGPAAAEYKTVEHSPGSRGAAEVAEEVFNRYEYDATHPHFPFPISPHN